MKLCVLPYLRLVDEKSGYALPDLSAGEAAR